MANRASSDYAQEYKEEYGERKVESPVTWTREEERRLVRKFDIRLMPFAVLMYFVCYLDRVNIGNARVANLGTPRSMEAELNLTGSEYQLAVSVFFITYVIGETPSNMVIKKFTPRIWLTRIMVTWGILAGCQAAAQNAAGLIATRLLVGLAEAGLFPGVFFYISFWYRKYEIASRTAIFHSSASIAGAFSGLLGAAIANMNGLGNLSGWRWIFIIEGFPPIILAVFMWFFLPDFPHTAKKWLTPREIEVAVKRLPPTAPSHVQKHFDMHEFMVVVKDPMNLLYPLSFAIGVVPQYGLSFFLPTILAGMGFTGTMANIMSAWPNVWSGIWELAVSFHSDYTQERPWHIAVPSLISLVGFALLPVGGIYHWPVGGRYFTTFLAASGAACDPSWYSFRQGMLVGATTNAVVMAWTNSVVNIAGAVSPFLFPTDSGPNYELGGYLCAAFWGISVIGLFFIVLYDKHRRRNGFYDEMEAEAKRDLERLNAMYMQAELHQGERVDSAHRV